MLPWMLLVACSSPETGSPGPGPGPAADDTSASADDTAHDTGGPDVIDGMGYLEGPPPALCQVTVVCGADIPDEPKIDCQVRVVDGDGAVHYDGIAGMERRGRSSSSAPKPQYGVELRDEEGDEVEALILGMSSDSDWILNGNYYDRSLFRTKLGFDLFRRMGESADTPRYAPRTLFCELSVDDTYMGIYTLGERIKRDDDRVDIDADDGDGTSWIAKLAEEDYLYENSGGYGGWHLVYPNPDEVSAVQEAGITETMEEWYGAMDSAEPALAFAQTVDRDALIDIVLLEEFLKNNDGWYLSLHAWKDPDHKVHISPWDLDLTLGQPSYNDNENPESWVAYRPALPANLAATDDFTYEMAARWRELRQGPLEREAVHALVDRYQETLAPAIDSNFEVWPIESIDFGGYLYEITSYEDEEAYVRAFIDARLEWMDDNVGNY